ncbi:MAG: ABC transporter substrate-binding protein, partial [Kofleriaceae bacterium]
IWIIAALAVGVIGGAAAILVPRLVSRRGEPPVARVVLPVAPAPVASPCPGPIRVRVMYDMTGDTKEVGTAAGKGEYDYLRAINAAGGIRGCKLEIDIQDTQYDKRASLDVYGAWKARPDWAEVSTVFLQGTPMTQALGPLATEDGKLVMSTAYAGELAAPVATSVEVAVPSLNSAFAEAVVLVRKQSSGYRNVFFQGTDYTTAARVAANYAWRQGAKRMAFFYCSKSSFCTDPVDGAKTFLTLLGGTKIGRDLFVELGDDAPTIERKVMQFFGQERQYKASHPDYEIVDWIWFGNTSTNTATLGRAIKKAKDTYGLAIHLIGNNWSVDETLYRRCGDACVGFSVVQPYALFGDLTMSGTARLLADHATYRQLDGDPADAYKTVQYVYGRVAVGTWKLAAERLLDQGKPVTGASLRAMLESFHNVDIEGFATIGYTPTDHRPQSGARVTQLGPHGRMEGVGQPMSLSLQTGWLGW